MTPTDPLWGLPDPDTHGEFYADTPFKRLMAWLVDTVAILLLTILVLPFTAFTGLFFFPLLFVGVSLVYRITTLSRGSATPGMRLMAVELRNHRGERVDTLTASLHVGLYLLFSFFFPLLIVSIILMLTTGRGQGLHDMILGTAVVNRAATV